MACATIALLAGCTTPQPKAPQKAAVHREFASCVDRAAAEAALDRPTAAPIATKEPAPTVSLTEEQQRERQFMLNYQANKMFRERHPLPADLAAANVRCVDEVRAGLTELDDTHRVDVVAVTNVLVKVGLSNPTVRRPGRLDIGPGDGLIFARHTGAGCLFGSVSRTDVTVEVGGGILDGGCLPAPD